MIHVGNQRGHLLAHALAGFHHQLGQVRGILLVLHEGAGTGFYVENQSVDALGELLAHDGRANQEWALDGAGDVAQRVELSIGRSNLGGLADHGAAAGFQNSTELRDRQIHVEAGDCFKLVERAAGVT